MGEFYTAPALFLHRASIYFLHKIATRKSGSLFYFFDFLFQPIKAALCVYSFRNITNAMANDNFYRIFVKASTLSHRYELDARIMWFMICIKTKHIANAIKAMIIFIITDGFSVFKNQGLSASFFASLYQCSTKGSIFECMGTVLLKPFSVFIPPEKIAIARAFYSKRIELIDKVIDKLNPSLALYVKMGVTEELTYDVLQIRGCPRCRDMYYAEYRYFFWRLSIERQ